MNPTCKQCGCEIIELELSKKKKIELRKLLNENPKLFAVKNLIHEPTISHRNAKVIIAHFNKRFGLCHKCNYNDLKLENIDCPKCGAFNYNPKI